MTNLPVDQNQEAFYALLTQSIQIVDYVESKFKMPVIQSIANEVKASLIKIDNSPKGLLLKDVILNRLLCLDVEFFPILEALANTENIPEIVECIRKEWLNSKDSNIRYEAAYFLASNNCHANAELLSSLLKDEPNDNVRLQILTSLKDSPEQNSIVMQNVFNALSVERTRPVLEAGIIYFEKVCTIQAVEFLTQMLEPDFHSGYDDSEKIKKEVLASIRIICRDLES